jgi:hypothetical protein
MSPIVRFDERAGMPGSLALNRKLPLEVVAANTSVAEGRPMEMVREHMEVIGADGVQARSVDKDEGSRIKLTKKRSGESSQKGIYHYIKVGLVRSVEGDNVRLSASGADA